MRYFILIIFLLSSLLSISQDKLKVLASSSWTAAFAYAAGFDDVDILAPVEMVHPSEYELQINDFKRIKEADIIVYGGYEVAFRELDKGGNFDKKKFVRIVTSYNLKKIENSVMQIASLAGTQDKAKENLKSIEIVYNEARKLISEKGLEGKPVICHFFQEEFIMEIGMNPVNIFGPSPLEVYEISALAKIKAVLIIDNTHNPVAQPLVEINKKIRKVELINFPGVKNTRYLQDVINYNINQVINGN